MKLRTSTWYMKLYRRSWSEDPQDGCQFFKRLALAFIMWPINVIFTSPFFIMRYFDKSMIEFEKSKRVAYFNSDVYGISLLMYCMLGVVISMILPPIMLLVQGTDWFDKEPNKSMGLVATMCWGAILTLGIYHGLRYIIVYPKRRKLPTIKRSYLLDEYIKSVKEKYCPRVEIIEDDI